MSGESDIIIIIMITMREDFILNNAQNKWILRILLSWTWLRSVQIIYDFASELQLHLN